MTVGLESASASGSAQQFTYVIDFALTAPLDSTPLTRKAKPRLGAWANVRLSGAPQQTVPSVKQFVGGFEKDLVGGNAQDIARSANVVGGLEFALPRRSYDFRDDYQFQPLLIAGVGFVTTPAPSNAPPIFEITDEARQRFVPPDDPSSYTHIGFLLPDRQNFSWQYYAGVRFRTHHFKNCDKETAPCSSDRRVTFPGTIDVTIGQNAAVTGGRLAQKVFGFDAFYPLPTDNLSNAIFVFGNARLHIGRTREFNQVVLRSPEAVVPVPSPELYLHTLTRDERQRDLWSVGLGLDLVRLFKAAAAEDDTPALTGRDDGRVLESRDPFRVIELTLNPNESGSALHVNDVVVPLTAASLEIAATRSNGDRRFAENWTAFLPVCVAGEKRTYSNRGMGAAKFLVVKPSNVNTVKPATATEPKPSLDRAVVCDTPEVRVERVPCAKGPCSENGRAFKGSVMLISSSGTPSVARTKAGVAGAPENITAGTYVILNPGEVHNLSVPVGAEVLIVEFKQ